MECIRSRGYILRHGEEMNTPKAVRQFLSMDAYPILDKCSRAGKYTVDSDFKGIGYVIENGMIGIVAGKNGMLSIDLGNIEDFIKELLSMKELAKDRKVMRVRGA